MDAVQRDRLEDRQGADGRHRGRHPAVDALQRAFRQPERKAGIFIQALVGIAIFFGLIELIALFIGVRLTRSMTKSVAELYTATQHVNRGDLSHRIQVETRDQMASLEAVVQLDVGVACRS